MGSPEVLEEGRNRVLAFRLDCHNLAINLTFELFEPVSQGTRNEIEAEAVTLAPYKGCASAGVELKKAN